MKLAGRVTVSVVGIILYVTPFVFVDSAYGISKSSLQAEASQLATTIADQSSQIHTLSIAHLQAVAELSTVNAQLKGDERRLATAQANVEKHKALLSKIAISQYMNLSGITDIFTELSMSQSEYVARIEFERVMGLDVSTAIFSYNSALRTLSGDLASAKAAQDAATTAKARIDASESSLLAAVSSEQSTLASVNSQISNLVQQQIAQRLALELQAKRVVSAHNAQSSQGAPTSSGLSSVSSGAGRGAGVSNWGGHPAPISAASLAALRRCESGGNYQDNTGNGYFGAYQFSISTWHSLGFPGIPSDASPATQDQAASILARNGWYSWPECSLVLGLN
ncbi:MULTISPECIES: transglycosylase family protein [Acidithrix]|uniref:Resuscitation-promoting factor Rpf n=1 Tax=Acidithrix ferrooxidans TaxID=1280514 RepID=A0A0D8HKB6_9ACTN|nr:MULTISPECIES: transglycosylase family protein [Acidithrix]KJF18207.1 resuscitation-promoting factor Rpf precursor [Acidithrix ferrooxidans]